MSILVVIDLALAGILVYKFVAILKHSIWVNKNGPEYRKALDRKRGSKGGQRYSDYDVYQVLRQRRFSGRSVPALGIKEYRVRSLIWELSGRSGIRASVLRLSLQFLLGAYDLASLAVVAGAALVWTGLDRDFSEAGGGLRVAAYGMAVALLMTISLVAIEPTIVYSRLGSYSAAFHSPRKYINREAAGSLVSELLILASLGGAVLYVDAAALSFMANANVDEFGLPALLGISGILDCVYSVFMTFLFASPLSPSTSPGQVFVMVLSLHSVLVITVALAGLFSQAKFPQGRL